MRQSSLAAMDPFNIKINLAEKESTLTILPTVSGYKIIYYGAILGAIKQVHKQWHLLPEDEIEPGELPLFDYRKSYAIDEPKPVLTKNLINEIANQIEIQVNELNNC